MTLIAFDVETTGLNPAEGHRIVEIGMVELDESRLLRTGRILHKYVNPGRPMTADAYNIHGLDDDFLWDKPSFSDIAGEVLEFVGDCRLLAHNARFDLEFLNAELALTGLGAVSETRILDSLELARQELPELSRFSLDALCRHYRIDASAREKHGALLDAELLADVYFRLIGGDKDLFAEFDSGGQESGAGAKDGWRPAGQRPAPLAPLLSEAEIQAHAEKIQELGPEALWNRWL